MPSRNTLMPILAQSNGILSGNNPRGLSFAGRTSFTGYVFGHSLFDHDAPPTANEFTNTGYWMNDAAAQSSTTSRWTQTFGQLRDQTIPPLVDTTVGPSNNPSEPWPEVPVTAWEDVAWDGVLIMASNFEQAAKTPETFVDESIAVLDYIVANTTGLIYLYGHWADPTVNYGIPVTGGNTMTPTDFNRWLNTMTPEPSSSTTNATDYFNWHIDYLNGMLNRNYNVRMIPVGPILADLFLNESYLSTIEFADIAFDSAPHFTPTGYFLAGMICYIALMGTAPSASYVPTTATPAIETEVLNNLSSIYTYIQTRLTFYNDPARGSRVY